MKIRTFRKCINRKKDYKYLPKYTHKILGIGLGEDTRYICGKVRARMHNGKFIVHVVKTNYTFCGHPVYKGAEELLDTLENHYNWIDAIDNDAYYDGVAKLNK